MGHFRWWLRWKQSRGHGVHSPFAFDLITNVISGQHDYSAFQDLPRYFETFDLARYAQPRFNQLSFRLINYFKAKRILEINAAEGVNTCYLVAPSSDIRCTCVVSGGDREHTGITKMLPEDVVSRCEYVATMPPAGSEPYDAIFVNLKEHEGLQEFSIDSLLHLSHENTFWVIYPISSTESKQFWTAIVKDRRFSNTFDRRKIGIAFLRPSFCKMHYWV
ncbi:MAG: hypothetical protein WCQ61_04845, partial [Proteiniphilum sp.]